MDAFGWLPENAGGAALADYAAQQGAQLVLVPAQIDEPDYLTAVDAAASVPVEVV